MSEPKLQKLSRDESSSSISNATPSSAFNSGSGKVLDSVLKPGSDPREYRALTLSNQLKVILISDPTSDKVGGSMSVGAGCLMDPPNLQGLAHFCEHMLFLGTKKYPAENDYDKYLSDNGGSSNAYTSDDHTNYYFDIAPNSLEPAIDRFSQFFIEPLFTESGTEKEINAVHAEHDGNIPEDPWRTEQIQKVTSSPTHPYHMFGTGNLDTLWNRPREQSIDTRKALLEFHSKYYSANIMTLALIGTESLDRLQEMVEQYFSPIVNKNVELVVWNESPFTENELGIQINIVPVKDLRQMVITFPFPDTAKYYKTGSDHYITHLIGHEGNGSLLSLLKKKNWVNELCSDAPTLSRGIGSFAIDLELTTDGLEKANEVVKTVFQYLEMLRSLGPQKWVWDELRDIQAMSFRFKDKTEVDDYVLYLTERMIKYPLEDVLSAGFILSSYNPEEITELMNYLVPEKCRITILTQDNENKVNLVEEYYGVKYSVEKIPQSIMDEWKNCGLNTELQLPAKNDFIPSLFDLKPRQNWGIHPRIVVENDLSRAWFLQDNEFLLPKAIVKVEIYSHLSQMSPLHTCSNSMLKRMVEDSLSEYTYDASVAGLEYGIDESVYGLEVYVSGYDHKLGLLLEKVLDKIINFSCESSRFEFVKEAFSRYLKNWNREQPRKHADYYLTYLLRKTRFTPEELIEALKDVTQESLCKYSHDYVSNVKLEWLLYGNLTSSEAVSMVNKCQHLFEKSGSKGIPLEEVNRLTELKLAPGSDFQYTKEHLNHSDSCCTVLYQVGQDETRINVLTELLDQIAYENCYNQLRTNEQLGYHVYTTVRKSSGTKGFQILVQSSRHPEYLDSRIDTFLGSLYDTITKMDEAEFLQHRNSLATRKAEKPKKLTIRAQHLWNEIMSRQVEFNRVEVELKELENITHQNAVEFFKETIGPMNNSRRRLAIHILSKAKKGAGHKIKTELADITRPEIVERNPQPVIDVDEWKSKHEFYPTPEVPSFKLYSHNEYEEVSMEL